MYSSPRCTPRCAGALAWIDSARLVTAVWALLAVPALAAGREGQRAAPLAYASALALLGWVNGRPRGAQRRAFTPSLLLGGLAGVVTYPAWLLAVGLVGTFLGLPAGAAARSGHASMSEVLTLCVLAPAVEELLYREYVLRRLRPHVGGAAAVLITSVLFALPHLDAWQRATTLLLGPVLGATRLAARSVAPCIGLHAGLNLAFLLWGVPGARGLAR